MKTNNDFKKPKFLKREGEKNKKVDFRFGYEPSDSLPHRRGVTCVFSYCPGWTAPGRPCATIVTIAGPNAFSEDIDSILSSRPPFILLRL